MTLRARDDGAGIPLSAIVVAYNSAADLPGLLRSLAASTVDAHVVVVDNGSTDASVAIARSFAGVEVVETGANLGYSGGINVGRAHVLPGVPIAILNPDLELAPDALERMLEALREPGVGVVGPRTLGPHGALHRSRFREPRLLGALGEAVLGDRMPRRPRALTLTDRREADYARRADAEWLSGAALLVSAACDAAVGAWDDETFFLYWEETDFQRRARHAGFRVVFEPAATVVHGVGGSGSSPALIALLAVNRVRYARKHHSAAWALGMRGATMLQAGLRGRGNPGWRLALELLRAPRRWGELPGGERRGASAGDAVDHVIVTRFNLPSRGFEAPIRAAEGWLRERIALFEHHTVPSVLAQRAADFRWVVYLDAAGPGWLTERMSALAAEGVLTPLYRDHEVGAAEVLADLRALIAAPRPWLLTTNLDNDDALAVDFTARLQAAPRPAGDRCAVYLADGVVAHGARNHLLRDPENAFCSVLERWDGAVTCWADWHNRLGRAMPVVSLRGAPAWLQVIHGRNVSNRVRGRLVDASGLVDLLPTIDASVRPSRADVAADALLRAPLRAAEGRARAGARIAVTALFGTSAPGRVKSALRRLMPLGGHV
ncbi:MAG: glycosyltransferase [Microbacteriaceae bacterium]|nr:glycosyltransferase [Microbacteriaceae bacterium]MCL2793677.1 glycosyltransferase [Microbacteriaceae bacterium]